MKTQSNKLSETRLNRLRAQGYSCESDKLLTDMAFGIRFAYRLCVAVIVTAIVTQSIYVFAAMTFIAFLGIVLPNHPFDYIYNVLLSGPMGKPKMPKRSNQLKFACTIATLWLVAVVALFATGNIVAGNILAVLLGVAAASPATIDFCVPSFIYNLIFKVNTQFKPQS